SFFHGSSISADKLCLLLMLFPPGESARPKGLIISREGKESTVSTQNLDMNLINRLRTAEEKVIKDVKARAAQVVAQSDEVETRRAEIRQQLEEDRRRLAIIERLREQKAEDDLSQVDEEQG